MCCSQPDPWSQQAVLGLLTLVPVQPRLLNSNGPFPVEAAPAFTHNKKR